MKKPSEMTAGELNRALDRIDSLQSKLTAEFIEAGRGHERFSDIYKKTDALSVRSRALFNERSAIMVEIKTRYGPEMSRAPLRRIKTIRAKNPSPASKAIRRQLRKRAKPPKKRNPAQHWYIHIQKHGQGPVMLFNGVSFSSPENRKPQPFATANAAMYKARHLLGKYHRHLRAYKIWVSDQPYGAVTQAGRVNPRKRKNPAVRSTLDQAARKLEDFTGREASDTIKAPARSNEKTGLVIGELKAVEYIAAREGIEGGKPVRWHHKFRKGSRPLLATTTDGKQLHVVGGQYEFTEAGIEDR